MLANEILNKKLYQDRPKKINLVFEKSWELVQKNCSDVLSVYFRNKKLLYRGVSREKEIPNIFLSQNRTDRRVVLGSNLYTGKVCDLYLKTAGFTALRGSSTFCNSELRRTVGWGETYIIFPLNGFKFTYSLEFTGCSASSYIYPAVVDKRSLEDYFSPNSNGIFPLSNKTLKDEANKFVKVNKFYKTNLNVALNKQRDIWFQGKFIAFKYNIYADKIFSEIGIE